MENNNDSIWEEKNKEIAYLCKKVIGTTYDEYHAIFVFANNDKTVEKYGKIKALDIVIECLKKSKTAQEALQTVFDTLDIVDLNARPDIVITP